MLPVRNNILCTGIEMREGLVGDGDKLRGQTTANGYLDSLKYVC
jgi:hypothetical protein